MVIQPAKRNFLSGDDSAFKSEGKSFCREKWYEHSKNLFQLKGRDLSYLWLANNQLTDIDPLLFTAESFVIPDNNADNRAAKRKTLVSTYQMKKKNDFIQIIDGFPGEDTTASKFDIVNLDSCNHLDQETIDGICSLLDGRIASHCYLFATFTVWSMRGIQYKRFPQYKRIAKTREEIGAVLEEAFKSYKFDSVELSGFPITYETGQKKSGHMFSFGWELVKL